MVNRNYCLDGELSAHRATAGALPRKMETSEFGCKNQDLNMGREKKREEAATITMYGYHGIVLKLTSGNEQKT